MVNDRVIIDAPWNDAELRLAEAIRNGEIDLWGGFFEDHPGTVAGRLNVRRDPGIQ